MDIIIKIIGEANPTIQGSIWLDQHVLCTRNKWVTERLGIENVHLFHECAGRRIDRLHQLINKLQRGSKYWNNLNCRVSKLLIILVNGNGYRQNHLHG